MGRTPKPATIKIKIEKIQFDKALYPRERVDEGTVVDYAEAMRGEASFPAIVVFAAGKSDYFLGDGRHRIEATRKLGRKVIDAEVRQGTRRDALLYAVGANDAHGLRRSDADKRKAVQMLLDDPEWRGWAVNKLAETCHVSWDLADSVRKQYLPAAEDSGVRRVERGGTVYEQNTARIGAKGRRGTKKGKSATPVDMLLQMISLTAKARIGLTTGENAKLVEPLNQIGSRLHKMVGQATRGTYMNEGLRQPLNVYQHLRTGGITETPEFAKKGLCTHAVNVGLICGHQCTYCSSRSLLRTHDAFKGIEQTSHVRGFAIVDPNTGDRIARDIPALTKDNVVQLCTLDDAWSPEARKHDLGRKCLAVLLEQTPAQVRILTKSAEVAKDFDLMKKYPGRVIVGLSTGAPPSREDAAAVIEPNASPVKDRLDALKAAHKMGLRTFGMLCPCLPGIADSPAALEELFDAVLACDVEDIWLEPVNARGKSLIDSEEALRMASLAIDADAIKAIRKSEGWSGYTTSLIKNAVAVAKAKKVLRKLHILLYPKGLEAEHEAVLRTYGREVIWLEKASQDKPEEETPAKPKKKRSRKAEPAAAVDEAVSQ